MTWKGTVPRLDCIRHAAILPQFRKLSAEKIDIQLKACFALLLGFRTGFLPPQAKQASYKGGDWSPKKLWWYIANAEYPRSNATLIFTYIFGICFVLAFRIFLHRPAQPEKLKDPETAWERKSKNIIFSRNPPAHLLHMSGTGTPLLLLHSLPCKSCRQVEWLWSLLPLEAVPAVISVLPYQSCAIWNSILLHMKNVSPQIGH